MYNYNSYHTYGYRNYNHSADTEAIAGISIAFFLIFALVAAVIGFLKRLESTLKRLGFLSITDGYSSNLEGKKAGNLF